MSSVTLFKENNPNCLRLHLIIIYFFSFGELCDSFAICVSHQNIFINIEMHQTMKHIWHCQVETNNVNITFKELLYNN